ncbi:LGRD-like protein [Mya arenaria]|uniref:Fatty acid synthase n=1 Tax=Mya arenaria TaxID=6604 RepID=A0ABY7DJV0_MYAAR|nr:LGRD-like protein [Mya arenaria]
METYQENGLLHEMFMRQAARTPEVVAVVEASGRQVTFGELDRQTNALAHHLQALGVRPDTCVGIYMDKCIEYVVAYIGILRAGGAYMPLDISYPEVLLKDILADAQPVAVLTEGGLIDKLEGTKNVLVMGPGWEKGPLKTPQQDIAAPTLDNLAYIVYSSGTTGKPKGIRCPHRGAVFSYTARHVFYPYGEEEREACNVFFVWEMLRPLIKGVPLYIIPSTVIYDPPLLCKFLCNNKITRMLFTPSLLEAVLNTPDLDLQTLLLHMRTIIFCGEVVTTSLFAKCLKLLPWIQFVNLYSVSECHDVCYEDLNKYFADNKDAIVARKFCPVGRVIPQVNVVILDADLNPQAVGSSGEIYVGGPTLALGYLNRPEIQAKRFIPRPASVPETCGSTLYRSGDWGYMLSDGSLEICGRCDSMVKVRGYSIEIQAVEAALMELPMVHSCVVLVKGAEGEDKFLVAYIVPSQETNRKLVRDALKKRLPFYMIPSYFMFLSKIPVVAATGKLDKAALPPYDAQTVTDVINEGRPTTETEVAMAAVWCKVLQLKEADIHEGFFDLGGHSLLVAELINKLTALFDVKLNVEDLFTCPTVARLSQLVDARKGRTEQPKTSVAESVDLMAEVERHDYMIVNIDMQLRAFWRMFAVYQERRFEKGRVLLTGATGFLGAFLLKELLTQTKVFVFCVCREWPDATPADRLRQTLVKFGILAPEGNTGTPEQQEMERLVSKRVMPMKGDVALVHLGLSDEDYTYMSSDVDLVVHAAASVNLVYPYTALVGPNVHGTANVIKFACAGKIKPIHYISTDAVFPGGMTMCSEEDDALGYAGRLEDGYSRSKWVAEQLVRRAMQRGLPATIYRLGNMSGDRKQAFWNPQDFTLLMLQASIRLGLAPDVDWDMEMTPVDFAAEFVVAMTKRSGLSLGKTFHIINDKPLKSRLVFEWMNAHGYPIQFATFHSWRQRALEEFGTENKDSLLRRVIESYITNAAFFSNLSSYTADTLHKTTSQIGLSFPYLDCELLAVKELLRHTEATLGPVDILVNNAGTMYYTMMKNLHEDEWDTQIDGLTNCIGAVLSGMIQRQTGHIINMSSDAGRRGFPGLAVYSGTKFYVEGLSQALRHEMSGSGVRVTCIQPGDVKTELLQHNSDTEAQDQFDGSKKCKILEPEDIARAVVYAASQPAHVGVNEILIEPREAPI